MHPFNVLGDPIRRRILELLAEVEQATGDIAATVRREFHLSQPAVSQQLKVPRDNGFATVRVDGSRRIDSIDGAALREADIWLDRFRPFWAPKLEALATEVARGKRECRQRDLRAQRAVDRSAQSAERQAASPRPRRRSLP
jgi:DNA-binding transcriptional ArsR family regulator